VFKNILVIIFKKFNNILPVTKRLAMIYYRA